MAVALTLTWTPDPVPAGITYVIYATRQLSAGVATAPRNGYRYLAKATEVDDTPFDVLTAYQTLFGPLKSGRRIFFRIKAIVTANGLASAALETSVVVT